MITRDDVLSAAGLTAPQTVPVHGVRARMATQMSLSRSQIPDAHASVQVDCSALLRLRDTLDVTPFVLTLRLLVIALGRHPLLNATWVESEAGPEIRLHPDVRLGVAVATERGLVVPVIDDAGVFHAATGGGRRRCGRAGQGGHAGTDAVERVDVHGVEFRRARDSTKVCR